MENLVATSQNIVANLVSLVAWIAYSLNSGLFPSSPQPEGWIGGCSPNKLKGLLFKHFKQLWVLSLIDLDHLAPKPAQCSIDSTPTAVFRQRLHPQVALGAALPR